MLPGIIGTLQANEVIKLILGLGTPAIGKLTTFDAMDLSFKTFKLRHDRNCPVCGDHPTITKPIDYEQFCGVPALDPKSLAETALEAKTAKGEAVPDASLDKNGLPPGYPYDPAWEVTPREVKAALDKHEAFVFIDCRLPNEHQITSIPGAQLIPLQQLAAQFDKVKDHKADKIIVHCKSGGRSMQFAKMLRANGFSDVKSMAGGILLWNKDVSPGGRSTNGGGRAPFEFQSADSWAVRLQSGTEVTFMPSPFPGMDPYLEDPDLWPDVHANLIASIQAELNQQIAPNYVARVEQRVFISDENDPSAT